MDNLSDSIGQLSMNAKEWRPGMGFQRSQTDPTPNNRPTTTSTSSLSTQSSPWVPSSAGLGGGGGGGVSSTISSSTNGINVNASNWVPQGTQQATQIQPQETKEIPEIFNSNIGNESTTASIPIGSTPASHQQTFNMNNPISLPLPKTLLNGNSNTALGGSGAGTGSGSNNNNQYSTSHLLSKFYRAYHIDCSNQMLPNDERYKAIPPSFINAMPLEQSNIQTLITTTMPSSNASNTNSLTNQSNTLNNTNNIQKHTNKNEHWRSSFGYPSSVFKVTNANDGKLYCLRRFDNIKCVNSKIASYVSNMWNHAVRNNNIMKQSSKKSQPPSPQQQHVLNHPGIVRFYKSFYINQNRALYFIHEYYPNALTLREALFGYKRGTSSGSREHNKFHHHRFHPLDENVIWSYVTQLVSAIKSVHLGGLAVRVLQLNHILVTNDVGSGFVDEYSNQYSSNHENMMMTNRVRLRINCIGVVDALEFESRKDIEECQKEDMRCLGRIMMSLASGFEIGCDVDDDTLNKCDMYLSQTYSSDLYNLTNALLSRKRVGRLGHLIEVDPPNIQNVCRVVGERALEELDSVHVVMDKMDEALATEYESGRGLRLLLKLGFINDRPEFGVDTRWSESGDCYVLKLFRDYGKLLLICNKFRHKHLTYFMENSFLITMW